MDIDKLNGTALIRSPLEMDSDVPEANSDHEQKTRTSLKISISTLALALALITVSPFAVARDGSYQWIRISNFSGHKVKVKYHPKANESAVETFICRSGNSCDIGYHGLRTAFGEKDKVFVVKIKPMGNNAVGYKRCADNNGHEWKDVGHDPIRYYRRIDVLWKLKVGKKAINCHWLASSRQ